MKKWMYLGVTLLALHATAAQAQTYEDDQYCREYTETVSIGGRAQSAYGTACLQPDGSWSKSSAQAEPEIAPVMYQQAHYVPPVVAVPRPVRTTVYVGSYRPYGYGYYHRPYRAYSHDHWHHRRGYRGHGSHGGISFSW